MYSIYCLYWLNIWRVLSQTFIQRWPQRYGEEERSGRDIMASSISDIWEQWNVRGFIILSFFFQFFLVTFAPLKKSTGRLTYWSLWFVYILASSAASYCIGLISNKQDQPGSTTTSLDLMAFWAAFLLVHLGGPDNITAFSLEDNDMWQRQFLTLLFQVITILYVFYETLTDNPLLVPFVLVFLAGMIKCGERIFALYAASTDTFREFVAGNPPDIGKIRNKKSTTTTDTEGQTLTDLQVVRDGYNFFDIFKGLVVDMKYSMNFRKETQDYFSSRTAEDALKVLEVELNFIYDVFYTKVWILRSKLGYFFRFVAFALIVSALGVFVSYDKTDFDNFDLVLTYVLLYGAVALDFLYLYMFFHSEWNVVFLEKFSQESSKLIVRIFPTKLYLVVLGIFFGLKRLKWKRCKKQPYTDFMELSRPAVFSKWPGYVTGYNLITHCLGRRDNIMEFRSAVYRFISHFGDRSLLRLFVVHNPFLKEFWEFIFLEIKRKSQDSSPISLEHIHGLLQPHIGPKRYTFEEMIIMCHITTDLCYSHGDGEGNPRRHFSRLLSEHMLYLLIMEPSTLQAVAVNGRVRFQSTCDNVKQYFFSEWRSMSMTKRSSKKEFYEGFLHSDRNQGGSNDSSLWIDARNLANKLNDSAERWEVMSQVWMELLMFTASTCSAVFLVRRLNKGAELICFVWLLMVHFGLGSQFHVGNEGDDP
ncbi:hypothetical protein L6164_021103 [Bauhinia variegata]|uniref:Uncharacterized protein n=1 Tax=Bauhinia variegata TaxID=167791 RepID=A0ACB9MYF2_BAUVA|nr:hypothetical protein L6164_021103 [Bauhinia variegata]